MLLIRRRLGPGNATGRNLVDRAVGWAWILGVLAAAYFAGPPGALFLFAVVAAQGLRELLSRRGISSVRDYTSMSVLFYGALPLLFALVPYSGYWLVSPVIGLAGLGLVLAAWASSPPGDARRRALHFHLALLGTLWGLPHVAALWYLRPQAAPASGPLLAGFLLLVVQSSDVAQYVSGRLLGRHPLSARSPSKTWEGFAGGLLFAVGLGVLLHGSTPFTWRQGAALALVVYLLGVAGGLLLSSVKRDLGLKDWSALLPGHGGMLDRVDSLLLSAPVYYHLVRLLLG
ncbi:MAG: phosphatidate cytidylyltransferase [Holophagales bacterium]|nr:phosphatidate cytidylyltransferase [Holophagales bacterium]